MAKIPEFKSIEEESTFWETHDSMDYLDDTMPCDDKFKRPPKKQVAFRLDTDSITKLKTIAKEKGLDWTALVRMYVVQSLKKDWESLYN